MNAPRSANRNRLVQSALCSLLVLLGNGCGKANKSSTENPEASAETGDCTPAPFSGDSKDWQPLAACGAPIFADDNGVSALTSVIHDSTLFVVGGSAGAASSETDNTAHVFDASQNLWKKTSSYPESVTTQIESLNLAGTWTGSEYALYVHNNLLLYNPSSDTWRLSSTNPVSSTIPKSLIWTGSEVIYFAPDKLNSATAFVMSAYDPDHDSWRQLETTGAPSPRSAHLTLWTGKQILVWGGCDATVNTLSAAARLDNGSIYDPATDKWTAVASAGLNDGYCGSNDQDVAVWTGNEALIFGSHYQGPPVTVDDSRVLLYDPEANTWKAASTTGFSQTRSNFTYGWTGKRFVIWGGKRARDSQDSDDGALYNPSTDSWELIPSSASLTARHNVIGGWLANGLLVWGGSSQLGEQLSNGGFSELTP